MYVPTISPKPEDVFDTEAFEYIDSQTRWNEVSRTLAKQSAIAFDLESNGYHRYPERICLIQIASLTQVYLVDPIAVHDLSELGKILRQAKILKIFHSCENDLRALDRDYGFKVKNIFDTAIAAHFLGSTRRGLSNVLLDFMGITLTKSKTLQRQDWTMRPLLKKSLHYAANDVALLLPLYEVLASQLKKAGRISWVEEEQRLLEKIKADTAVPAEALFWSVKGCKDLNEKQRAILKELVVFRDRLCRKIDRTPFRVLGDDVLLVLAKKPDSDLKKTKGMAVIFHQKRQKALQQALQKGKQAVPVPLPSKKNGDVYRKKSDEYNGRFKALKSWRMAKGERLALDPALLWPMQSLEQLAGSARLEKALQGVRQWQRKTFEKEILEKISESLISLSNV
ncbi:hypothetical protein K8S19_11385 [bacterium]|nr:hypothetical protein [bacterium]